MNIARAALVILLSLTILCGLLLIRYAYKRRGIPGANGFILLAFSAIAYIAAYIGEISSDDLQTAMFWFDLEHIPIPIQHYLWLILSLQYCKVPKRYLQYAGYIGLYHPILYMLIYYTNDIHHLYISSFSFVSNGYFPVIITVKGPFFFLVVASGTLLAIVSCMIYLQGLIKSSNLHRYGYMIMILASVFPWLAVYLNAADLSYLGIDYFPVFSALSGVIYILGIFKFRIFNVIPIATEIVFRQSKEGVMIIDMSESIVDVNEAFVRIYPELKNLYTNRNLVSFLEKHPELKGINESEMFKYKLVKDGVERHYSVSVTRIIEEGNVENGKIVYLDDISAYVENQIALESIAMAAVSKAETNEISFLQAQIKPHFLNNILSVIGSMITRDPHGARELIGNLGEYLANSCYFDSSSPMVSLEQELEAINTYVAIERARFGDRLNYHVVCSNIPDIMIPKLILQPLIENSIQHGILKKAEGGNVWLIITAGETGVSFEIKDDGVGTDEDRLNKILSGVAEKNGIGINNINKRLIMYYGDGLTIKSTKNSGTSARFSIPYK